MICKPKSGFECLLIYRSKYMLTTLYIILKWDSPKLFSISLKWHLLATFVCFISFYQNKICFAETYYSDSRNLYSSKNIVTNFYTFFKTLLGLCHFEIVCVFVKIYFDILIKRRSIPLLVLGAVILRASIFYVLPHQKMRRAAGHDIYRF